jgi:hypothetical protein
MSHMKIFLDSYISSIIPNIMWYHVVSCKQNDKLSLYLMERERKRVIMLPCIVASVEVYGGSDALSPTGYVFI